MAEIVSGGVFLQVSEFGHIASDFGALDLLEVGSDLSELGEETFVSQEVDIFHVVISLTVTSLLLGGFSGVDAFQDAESAEIFQF